MMYYVGPDRAPAYSVEEALELAVKMIPEKRLGDCVNIYNGKKPRSPVRGRVKAVYDRELGRCVYIYYGYKCKWGHTIRADYSIDVWSRWCNAAF